MVLVGTYLMRLKKPDSCDELLSSEYVDLGEKGLLEFARETSMSAIGESTVCVSVFSILNLVKSYLPSQSDQIARRESPDTHLPLISEFVESVVSPVLPHRGLV
jgi:hypothetical protein